MSSKKKLLSIILVFVLILGGAYVLYDRFGKNIGTQQMVVHAEQETTQTESGASPQHTAAAADDPGTDQQPDVVYAPDFSVYDSSGNEAALSSYFGKPIVLNFWASWCGPCRSEMPDFNEKHSELGDDVHFIMVNMTDGRRETVETATDFVKENGYGFPVFFDIDSEAAMTYGAYSLPTTFFINAEGHVVAQATGALDAATLQRGIDMIY